MNKYFKESDLKTALNNVQHTGLTTFIIVDNSYLFKIGSVYRDDNIEFLLISLHKNNDISIFDSIEALENKLSDIEYEVINTEGLKGLQSYLFREHCGLCQLFDKNVRLKEKTSLIMLNLISRSLNKEITIDNHLTFVPDNKHAVNHTAKIKDTPNGYPYHKDILDLSLHDWI